MAAHIRIFDPSLFRAMLDEPGERADFVAMFPTARALFAEYLDVTALGLADFPADGVTALQFTAFDNGPEPSARKLTMQSRLALHVKAWDRLNIDWKNSSQVAWEATACLRSRTETEALLRKLIARRIVGECVPHSFRELCQMMGDKGLYGLFHQRRPGMGSRWTDVLAHVEWEGVGLPGGAVLVRPDRTGYRATAFDASTATGDPLSGKAVAQARVAFTQRLAGWATETHP